MPKERRTRLGAHQPSVKLGKRTFAVQENAVKHVEIGSAMALPADAVLQAMTSTSEDVKGPGTLTKKEKQTLKREAFLQKLDPSRSTHSKSHERRVKRKAKEQIANGLTDIQEALAALEEPQGSTAAGETLNESGDMADPADSRSKSSTSKSLKIGEGKSATLSKAQRRRALELERLRQPLILTNPSFSSNPFSTIRLHAQNTLLKHQTPT